MAAQSVRGDGHRATTGAAVTRPSASPTATRSLSRPSPVPG